MQASLAFAAGIWVFNEFAADSPTNQVSGMLAAAPMLAAVLVQKAHRVLITSAFAGLVFFASAASVHITFDDSQFLRLGGIAVSTVVGLFAAQSRLRDLSKMLALGEVAKTAQQAIMRISPPDVEGVDAAVRYVSSSTEANIGGDAYEALLTPFGLRVLVADARGKGLPAVLSSAVAMGAFREWAFIEEDLGDLLCRMDASVRREVDDEDFVTALVAEFNGDELRYACAGHPHPVLLRAGSARELPTHTVAPLSLFPDDEVPEVARLRVQKEDVVLMFSDGLADSRNEHGEFFGVSGALLRVAEHAVDIEECADGVLAELRDFVEGELEDDVALVALRITKPVAPLNGDRHVS